MDVIDVGIDREEEAGLVLKIALAGGHNGQRVSPGAEAQFGDMHRDATAAFACSVEGECIGLEADEVIYTVLAEC